MVVHSFSRASHEPSVDSFFIIDAKPASCLARRCKDIVQTPLAILFVELHFRPLDDRDDRLQVLGNVLRESLSK